MMASASAVLLLLLVPAAAVSQDGGSSCDTPSDCSLNGLCKAGSCVCFAPWSTAPGDALGCGRLDTLPGPKLGCYGQQPHVPSWGGNAILFEGEYHLFVSSMTEDCGLSDWPTNMQIDHAVSKNATGPYVKKDVALPAPATNPQAIVDANGTWWLFHIGDAHGASAKNCTGPPPAPLQQQQQQPRLSPGTLQRAPGPAGPWTAVKLPFGCNNPAPGLANDGSYVVLVCTWSVHKAPTFAGPWTAGPPLNPTPIKRTPAAHWEDPYIYQDLRGHWHLLAHVYNTAPFATTGLNYISGHGFSEDGLNWNMTLIEPYSYNVTYDDGSHASLATRERPKLIFDPTTKEPAYIITATSAHWPCTGCPHGGACIDCKVTSPWDKDVFTMIQPLRMKQQ